MKRWLALGLAVLLSAGCTSSANSGGSSASAPAATGGADIQTDEIQTDETGLKPVDLVYYIRAAEQDNAAPVQAAMDVYFKEKLNCTVKIIPINEWATKMPLVLSSGEQVDLTFDQANTGYYTNVSNNMYLPLDDLLNQYGQGILEQINVNCPGLIDAPKVNGVLYGIPCEKQTAQCEAWYFRKDIADEIGLDADKLVSLQDLEPFLAKIKETRPEMTPYYVSAGTGVNQEWITDAIRDNPEKYEELNGAVNLLIVDLESDTVLNHYETEWDVDRYQTLKSWQDKGYINTDAATTTTAAADIFRAGKTWFVGGGGAPTTMSSYETGYGTMFYRWRSTGPIVNTYQNTTALTCVTRTTADAERAMMVLNLFHTDPVIVNLFNSGIEGVNYVIDENGRFALPEGAASRADTGYNYGFDTFFGNMFLNSLWNTDKEDRYDELRGYNQSARQSKIMGFYVDMSAIVNEYAAVEAVRTQYAPLLKAGVVSDVQAALKEMNDKMYANGLQKIIDEAQRQYDAFVAAGGKKS
ncbi:MAG: ABC transporter substrate-binding protein [Clostridiales bacterium]|jgi:putative aldouronate transport system substrate-binding protein|nr:ABC transporter substrate-binding protein [Clostridiales bacterium]